MLNETTLLRHLQRRIGTKLFNALDIDYFLEILNEETLVTWSSYYPKLIKGIKITEACAIPTFDPINNVQEYHTYTIPKLNPGDEYIGIEKYIFMGQHYGTIYAGFNGPLADAALSKVRSLQPIPDVKWSATFEAPNFVHVFPYRRNHQDFVLVMQRKIRLTEIDFGLQEYFKRLFVLDVKAAIYNDFPAARETGVLNGVEVNTTISDFSNAESDRNTLLETFDDDYYKNPDRFDTFYGNQT